MNNFFQPQRTHRGLWPQPGKMGSWEAGKKHENCVRFSECSGIMVRKKIAKNPHHRIDTTVTEIKCCNKNKKLKDCSTSSFSRLRSKKKPPAAGISNTEQGMSNFEGKRRFAPCFNLRLWRTILRHSIFLVRYSIFKLCKTCQQINFRSGTDYTDLLTY